MVSGWDEKGFIRMAGRVLRVSPEKIERFIWEAEPQLELGAKTSWQFWKEICKDAGIPAPPKKAVANLWEHSYKKTSRVHSRVVAFVRYLAKKYPVGIISNTIEDHIRVNVKRGIFRGIFVAIHSSRVGLRKPDRRIFLLAAKRMRMRPRNLVFVDDKPSFAAAARRVGMHGIVFRSLPQIKHALRLRGLRVDKNP